MRSSVGRCYTAALMICCPSIDVERSLRSGWNVARVCATEQAPRASLASTPKCSVSWNAWLHAARLSFAGSTASYHRTQTLDARSPRRSTSTSGCSSTLPVNSCVFQSDGISRCRCLSLWLIGTVRAEPETVNSRAWVQSPDPAE